MRTVIGTNARALDRRRALDPQEGRAGSKTQPFAGWNRVLAVLAVVGLSLCLPMAVGEDRPLMPFLPNLPTLPPPSEAIPQLEPIWSPGLEGPALQPMPPVQRFTLPPLSRPLPASEGPAFQAAPLIPRFPAPPPPLSGRNVADVPCHAVPVVVPTPAFSLAFQPWWQAEVTQPIRPQAAVVPVNPTGLVLAALAHSAQIRALNESVFISQSTITEAEGKFDARAFAESRLVDDSDPVGNTLTTGGPPRWIDTHWYGSAGIRKQGLSGGQLEVSQQIGYEDSNSLYFVPNHQGTARLGITLTQPLLNGAGAAYNSSVMVLANINSEIARDRFSRDLQGLLLDLYRNYWDLYLQRSALAQRTRLYRQAIVIRDELQARQALDATYGQFIRAEAAVASREAALTRYRAAVQNTEARIRALVNDPALAPYGQAEMIPAQMPIRGLISTDLSSNLTLALKTRPEIQQGIKEIRAAGVRTNVATNEVLPVLNAIIETYVSGLEGGGMIDEAYADQFRTGRPSYTGGLHFEVPLGGNRSANARLCQRQAELRQATSQLEATTANIRAEVEIAVRDVDTSYREMVSKFHAMAAGEGEIAYLTARWRALPGDQQNAGFALDELLSAQERLAQAELDFAIAEAGYNVALIALGRVTGTMVSTQDLDDILKQPGFAHLKKDTRLEPAAATAAVNHSSAAVVVALRPPDPGRVQQSPLIAQPAPAAQPFLMPQPLPPWELPQPAGPPFPTLGIPLDQLEER